MGSVTTENMTGKKFRIEYEGEWSWEVGPAGNRYQVCQASAAFDEDGDRVEFSQIGADAQGTTLDKREYLDREAYVVTVTTDGRALRCYATDFHMSARGAMGVSGIMGEAADTFTVKDIDQIVAVTNKGTMARFEVAAIRVGPRIGCGVVLMNLHPEEFVSNVSVISGYEEPDEYWGTREFANVSEA